MKKIILILITFFFASCASIDLFNKDTNVTNINTTIGEELVDLEKALESGIITEEEYNEMKSEILKRYSK